MWKEYTFPAKVELRNRYAFSSLGRMASFRTDVYTDGRIIKGGFANGYLNLNVGGKSKTAYIHRIIAGLFLPRPSPRHEYVLHINHNRHDNAITNLRWATSAELQLHRQHSPGIIAYRHNLRVNKGTGVKKMRIKKIDRLNFELRMQRIKAIAAAIDLQ